MTTHYETITSLCGKLSAGDISSVELTRDALARIADLNPELNAVVASSEAQAIDAATRADKARLDGNTSPLLGLSLIHI